MSENTANNQATVGKHNNQNEEKNMSKKTMGYIVKEGSFVNAIRFNNPHKSNEGYTRIGTKVTGEPFILESSYVIAENTCISCEDVSYAFSRSLYGPIEISEQDLIVTELFVNEC